MNDTNCPYCGAPQEINHDDGYGYAENELHHQQCDSCGKEFVFTTSVIFFYETYKADCLNGGSHEFEPTDTYPVGNTKMQCVHCGERRTPTAAEMALIIEACDK